MRIAACLLLVAALLAGCTTHSDGPSAHQTASGAAGGGSADLMDRQEAELRLQLGSKHEVEIERVRADMLRLTLANEISFDTNGAVIKPTIAPTLAKVAEVLARYQDSQVTIVGHTDSTGSGDYNRFLSRDRAVAVLEALTRLGVPADRLIAFGRGESEPRSDNATSDGRARNRRLEILLTAA